MPVNERREPQGWTQVPPNQSPNTRFCDDKTFVRVWVVYDWADRLTDMKNPESWTTDNLTGNWFDVDQFLER